MSDRGYIYVLINPLMAGLVKVGKTTRDPEERAADLSSATGVPAPFIVAYQREVNDCTRAEEFVHSYLTDMGCRVSDNREFFRVDLTTAINAVLEYCKLENSSDGTFSTRISDDDPDDIFDDEPDSFLSKLSYEEPLHSIELGIGTNYRYGRDDYIQDYEEALKHYKLAIKYGSTDAYRLIGEMYFYGEGVKVNHSTALSYFKQGIEHGDYFCYSTMATVYLSDGNKKNADKCFYKAMNLCDANDKWIICSEYINTCLNYSIAIDHDKIELMRPYKKSIMEWFSYSGDNESLRIEYRKKKQYIQDVIFNYTREEKLCEAEEELGSKYYWAQDYEEAMKHYMIAVKYGSTRACYHIGTMYLRGEGVQENHFAALQYFKQGIERGKRDRNDDGYLYLCYSQIIDIYLTAGQQKDADKYFIEAMKYCNEEDKAHLCVDYIDRCLFYGDNHMSIEQNIVELMRPYKNEILKECLAFEEDVTALFD